MASNGYERLLPERGGLWLAALGAGRVGEASKTRPVLILTNGGLTQSIFDLVVVVPLSASLPRTVMRPAVLPCEENGLTSESVVATRALRAISPSRLLRQIGRLDSETIKDVEHIVTALLGLSL